MGSRRIGGRAVDASVWTKLREFTADFLRDHPSGIVARYSTTHVSMKTLMAAIEAPAVARAGNGVVRGYSTDLAKLPGKAKFVLEHTPAGVDRWPEPGGDLAVMRQIKNMFDPNALLNKGMLYGKL